MPQLDFSTYWGQFLWLSISFSALYLLIQFVFFPRIERTISSRRDLIEKNLVIAEKAIFQTEEIRAEIEIKLQHTNKYAQQLSSEAERSINILLETKLVESENLTAKVLKKEAKRLAASRKIEIEQYAPVIIAELKETILHVLTKNLYHERKNDYSRNC